MIKKSENFIFSEKMKNSGKNEIFFLKWEKMKNPKNIYVYIYAIFINKSNLQKNRNLF